MPSTAEKPLVSRFEASPNILLRPYVQSYWGFARDLSQLDRFTVTPDCFLEVLFFDDPPYIEDAGGLRSLPACTLIPLLDAPLHLFTRSLGRCAAIRFHAWVAGMLFPQANVPAQAWFDVSASFAKPLDAITQRLRRAEWAELVDIFDRTLLRMLADGQTLGSAIPAVRPFLVPPDGTMVAAADEIAAYHGGSRRQIERRSRSLTNRSPKQLVCLARFQFVRDALWARPDTELSCLATEAGYADQAHLARQFRRYAGQSATEFKRDCMRLKAFLHDEDVAFVQDEADKNGYTTET